MENNRDIHLWRKIKKTSRETIIEKTKNLPNCNDCADAIVTGRIEPIWKVKSEGDNPFWS